MICLSIILQQQAHVEETDEDVEKIIDVATNEGLTVEEWEVVHMDTISQQRFEYITNILQSRYLDTVTEDENKIKYVFEAQNSEEMVHHYFQVIVPNNRQGEITLQTVISGSVWNESTADYYKDLTKTLQNDLLVGFDKTFTCVKLNNSGIINSGFSGDEIWQKMKVIHKSEYYDNVPQSNYSRELYGFTPLSNSELLVSGEKINFHMIMKDKVQNEKQVIIGTPIILNEY